MTSLFSLPEASYEDFSCRMSPVTVTFRTESATGTRLPRLSFMSLVFWVLFFRQEKLFEKKVPEKFGVKR